MINTTIEAKGFEDSDRCDITFTLNGQPKTMRVHPLDTVLEAIRESCHLTGTKGACHEGECGSCTVLIDGVPMNSCLIFSPQIAGKSIVTVEGLASGETLDRVQQAFLDCGAVQCGYCTPGLLIAAKAFLRDHPNPTREEICVGMEGNICRCTGYMKVLDAVIAAAKEPSHD